MRLSNATRIGLLGAVVVFIFIGMGVEVLYREVRSDSGPHGYYIVITKYISTGTFLGSAAVSTTLTNDGRFDSLAACDQRLRIEQHDGVTTGTCVKMLNSDAAHIPKV